MTAEHEDGFDAPHDLGPGLKVDTDDPELARARAAIGARLLGLPEVPPRIGRFVVLERIGSGGMGIVYSAFDPQLDRKVAIKLLTDRRAGPDEHARLIAEAKAMAKLAHPNVVQVFEVGEHHGQVFVAMEQVRGQTLREWCSASRRSVTATLAVCRQAGEGLAAAHAAGIVHRDFKPDNVIVGEDGLTPRARVLDFGLARTLAEPTDADVDSATNGNARPGTRTSTGVLGGTPGYVAPERLRGEPSDASSDQFSFCVTVWEALVGALPFAGDGNGAITSGRIATPPRARMPMWIERVLRRGLADDPHAAHRGRYPDLQELLRALARDPALVRRRRLGVAAVVVGIAGAFAVGNAVHSRVDDDPCGGGAETIAGAWSADERAAALARVVEIGGAYGAAIAPRLAAQADTFVQAWTDGHRDACMAHRRDEQSAELLDRRMVCLHRGRSAFAALRTVTDAVEPDALPDLVPAFQALPDPNGCADLPALTAITEAPPAAALPLSERLGEIEILWAAGKNDTALELATKLVEDAREVGYGPRLAEVLLAHGELLMQGRGQQRRLATTEMLEAVGLALTAGDDRTALRAWAGGAWGVAVCGTCSDIVFDGQQMMQAIAEREANRKVAIMFYTRVGGIALTREDREQARVAYRRALEISAQSGYRNEVDLAFEGLALVTDDPQERARLFEQAVAATIEKLGPEHPRAFDERMTRAGNLDDAREARDLLVAICAERRSFFPGDHGQLSSCEKYVSWFAEITGDRELARAAAARWASESAAGGQDDVEFAKATASLLAGNAADAAARMEPIVRESEAERGPDQPFYFYLNVGDEALVLGRAWRELGDPRATEMLARALADLERGARVNKQPAVRHMLERARIVIGRG